MLSLAQRLGGMYTIAMQIAGLENNTGMLLVDKPSGCTSHDVVAFLRGISGVRKVGHAGTLDPLATGLLILLMGKKWTRRQSEFMGLDKEYSCEVLLGLETDTYDVDGKTTVMTDLKADFSLAQLSCALEKLSGTYQQVVPAFAAVKRKGKKLYELARDGLLDTTSLPSREVTISNISDIKIRRLDSSETALGIKNKLFTQENATQLQVASFRTTCSSGTYIRSLAFDLGRELGCGGAILSLRRERIGTFHIAQAQLCPLFRCRR